jgi:hypothetical protein
MPEGRYVRGPWRHGAVRGTVRCTYLFRHCLLRQVPRWVGWVDVPGGALPRSGDATVHTAGVYADKRPTMVPEGRLVPEA